MPAASPTSISKPVSLGLGMHSYGEHWRAARERHPKSKFHDALSFLEHAEQLGADGVQVSLGLPESGTIRALRQKQERRGLYLEAQTSLPADESDRPRFRRELDAAVACGATVVRSALLSGRRYETFKSGEEFRAFHSKSWASLQLAEREARAAGIRLAVENHKDFLAWELVEFMSKLSSEFVGVCVDCGNNIALLEDPYEVVAALAPYAASVHFKDMGVAPSTEGFLLSEVPFGSGLLDLRRMGGMLLQANPALRFNIEMITRNPLSIPCLRQNYWATFTGRHASELARSLAGIRQFAKDDPLPSIEGKSLEERLEFEARNVRLCLAEGRVQLRL